LATINTPGDMTKIKRKFTQSFNYYGEIILQFLADIYQQLNTFEEDTKKKTIEAMKNRVLLSTTPAVSPYIMTFSTIHGFKGLQSPVVFLLQDGRRLGYIQRGTLIRNNKLIDEDAYLYTTAITRCQGTLILPTIDTHMIHYRDAYLLKYKPKQLPTITIKRDLFFKNARDNYLKCVERINAEFNKFISEDINITSAYLNSDVQHPDVQHPEDEPEPMTHTQ